MTADDIIIDDDDWFEDDPDDPGGGGSVTSNDYETIIVRPTNTSQPCTSYARAFTQVKQGKINFGNRNTSTGALTTVFSLYPAYSGSYYGIGCNAGKIDIRGDGVLLRVGSRYGATGTMSVITDVALSQQRGVSWTIEKLPFYCGLCVAER